MRARSAMMMYTDPSPTGLRYMKSDARHCVRSGGDGQMRDPAPQSAPRQRPARRSDARSPDPARHIDPRQYIVAIHADQPSDLCALVELCKLSEHRTQGLTRLQQTCERTQTIGNADEDCRVVRSRLANFVKCHIDDPRDLAAVGNHADAALRISNQFRLKATRQDFLECCCQAVDDGDRRERIVDARRQGPHCDLDELPDTVFEILRRRSVAADNEGLADRLVATSGNSGRKPNMIAVTDEMVARTHIHHDDRVVLAG